MRIWSIHPQYLDTKGLVALWREALLAKKVLEEKTKGYRHHPQLERFKKLKYPVDAIDQYLHFVWLEARKRNYNFNRDKISTDFKKTKITVTSGQLSFESNHLLGKLKKRDPLRYKELRTVIFFDPHPIFRIKEGEIEDWEISKTLNAKH